MIKIQGIFKLQFPLFAKFGLLFCFGNYHSQGIFMHAFYQKTMALKQLRCSQDQPYCSPLVLNYHSTSQVPVPTLTLHFVT